MYYLGSILTFSKEVEGRLSTELKEIIKHNHNNNAIIYSSLFHLAKFSLRCFDLKSTNQARGILSVDRCDLGHYKQSLS